MQFDCVVTRHNKVRQNLAKNQYSLVYRRKRPAQQIRLAASSYVREC